MDIPTPILLILPLVVGFICLWFMMQCDEERRNQRQKFDDMIKKDYLEFKKRNGIK